GVSTRLIGALIMAHSDDNGLVLPPKIAPAHLALIPIYRDEHERDLVMEFCQRIEKLFAKTYLDDIRIFTELDDRDLTSSERNWYWIKKGIPIRIEIGPRDVSQGAVMVARRDHEPRDKQSIAIDELCSHVIETLQEMQQGYYQKALSFRQENTIQLDNKDDFYRFFTPENTDQPEIHGGFASSHWCGNTACEEKIKDDLKVTIRCIPFDATPEPGECIACGMPSQRRVIFAKSY
ncbi:MAG TPA: His/Gly/Thr/Pro-type tRNA ligase C-terminal domain-containing protein, partial [Candidatus Cloacimonadota bacterium]|nr:His/Gly/Thr/Pro-type tRNA ligase C-terminal domain-containing protein [Candidatus Cloacimonadota bacterium]